MTIKRYSLVRDAWNNPHMAVRDDGAFVRHDDAITRLSHALAAEEAKREAIEAAINGMVEILDRNNTKGPISDVDLMFCWMAAQDVRAASRKE